MARTFGAQRGKPQCFLTQESRRKGGIASGKKRRAAAMARMESLSKIDIARIYFSKGWKQGVRTERRRQTGAA